MTVDALPATLITGAADRIGRAMALDLARQGTPVAIHYNRSGDKADTLVADITSQGGTACAIQADLIQSVDLDALIGDASERLQTPVRCLVNNASLFLADRAGELQADLFAQHFQIHCTAPALLADALVRSLTPYDDALIVNIIDQRVWRLTPHFVAYTASKFALWGLTQTLAQAYAESTNGRVRVNAIGPGPTLANPRQAPEDFDEQATNVPLGRGPDLAAFARTLTYLWQMKAVTGQMIALDGGQHLAWKTPDVLAKE